MKLSKQALVLGVLVLSTALGPAQAANYCNSADQAGSHINDVLQEKDNLPRELAADPDSSTWMNNVEVYTSNEMDTHTSNSFSMTLPNYSSELDTTSFSCGDMKNHAAVFTALLAAGATLAASIASAGAFGPVFVSVMATAGNGLTNYISCPGSPFQYDMQLIENAAQKVFIENYDYIAGNRAKAYFDRNKNENFYKRFTNELDDKIADAMNTYEETLKALYLAADDRMMMFARIVELYTIRLMRTGTDDWDINSSSTCKDVASSLVAFLQREKTHILKTVWQPNHQSILDNIEFRESDRGNHVYRGMTAECRIKYFHGKCYEAEYDMLWSYIPPLLERAIWLEEARQDCYDNLMNQIKPEYYKWYKLVAAAYQDAFKIIDGKTEEELKKSCGKFEDRMPCVPTYFKSGIPGSCCGIHPVSQCRIFEGKCGNDGECFEGGVCRTLEDISSSMSFLEFRKCQRSSGWKYTTTERKTKVCYDPSAQCATPSGWTGQANDGLAYEYCRSNGECKSGNCVDNHCIGLSIKQPCTKNEECASLSCAQISQYSSSLICKGQIGDTCSESHDCKSLKCKDQKCVLGQGVSYCETNEECESGFCSITKSDNSENDHDSVAFYRKLVELSKGKPCDNQNSTSNHESSQHDNSTSNDMSRSGEEDSVSGSSEHDGGSVSVDSVVESVGGVCKGRFLDSCWLSQHCQSGHCDIHNDICEANPLEFCMYDDDCSDTWYLCEDFRCKADVQVDRKFKGKKCESKDDCFFFERCPNKICDYVPPPPPTPGPCFSSNSQVHALGKDSVQISDIEIGDYVQSTKEGTFSRVYALEKDHHRETKFYQIHTLSGVLLELTDRHMVYLKDKALPVPAKNIRIGDVLDLDDSAEDFGEVSMIEIIHRHGHYNPLTEDGTLIVNDVLVSSFSVARSSTSSYYDNHSKMVHWHTLSHVANAPLRFVCKRIWFGWCAEERFHSHENNGLHKYVVLLKNASNLPWWKQSLLFPFVISMSVFFTLLEFFYDRGEKFFEFITSTFEAGAGVASVFSVGVLTLTLGALGHFALRKKQSVS